RIFPHAPQHPHLSRADRAGSLRASGPDRGPAAPGGGAARGRGARSRPDERQGGRGEELCHRGPRPGPGARRSGRGVLDADFNGPTIPALLRIPVTGCALHENGVEPPVSPEGVRCFSMALLLQDGRPLGFRGPDAESHVWRETLEAAALREFLADVAWGALDRLLVDLPPGIQRFQELAELLPAPPAVLTVTIPTTESRDAVRRAMQFARERGAELLGVVENMVDGPFTGDAGEALAREFAIPLVARVP